MQNKLKRGFSLLQVMLVIAIIGLFAAIAIPKASAQVTPGPYVYAYPLTNSLAGTTNYIAVTNGSTTLSSNCTYIVQSQPFLLWPGRGFAFNAGFVNTNANTSVLTFNFRFATRHPTNWSNGQGFVTNWNTANLLAIGASGNGLTPVYFFTNVTGNVVDNVQLGQLYSIGVSTGATATLLDPTNTFIGEIPH